ncbi:MAG: outer membrane lipoprotein LolB [Burkholderiales bacterium]
MKQTARVMLRLAHYSTCCALALPLLLAGCASQTRNPAPGNATSVLPTRTYSEAIDIDGRFSVELRRHDKTEVWNGNFSWTQSAQGATVTLQSPLGQTLAMIAVNGATATLTQSGKPQRSAANVDALAEEALGWPLPISDLHDWLQAYVVTADGKRIMATPQSTAMIVTRDGWHIVFTSWQKDDEIGARDVPKRIDMERDTVEAGKVLMRLVITSWQPR